LNDDLINKTLQYKVIQKKLLLHYKDKIPTSLIGLRSLLDRTYASIHTISSDIINLKKENRISTYNFVVISHMILELWRFIKKILLLLLLFIIIIIIIIIIIVVIIIIIIIIIIISNKINIYTNY